MYLAAASILAAYLLGSALGSLLVGKVRGGIDIRTMGSGNAGGTNALRTQGLAFALAVMIIDIGKGYLATKLLPELATFPGHSFPPWLSSACAAAVVLGHVYPVWFGFRGGKGAATLIGVVLGLVPTAAIPVLAIWLLVLLLSGYVGLATMLATMSFPIYAYWFLHSPSLCWFGLAMTLLVLFTHRSNIARMRAGSENRATRIWLLRPR